MKERHLDEKIILFVYSDLENGISATDGGAIMNEFKNYSRGYLYDRLMVLKKNGFLSMARIPGRYFYITDKGIDWAKELKEKEQ